MPRMISSAARYADDGDVAFLWSLVDREKGLYGPQSKMEYLNVNEAFHMGIARISRNKYLEQYCRHSFWRSHTYIFFFDSDYLGVDDDYKRKGPRQHIEVVRAIEAGDADLAARLMSTHVQTTFEQLFTRI